MSSEVSSSKSKKGSIFPPPPPASREDLLSLAPTCYNPKPFFTVQTLPSKPSHHSPLSRRLKISTPNGDILTPTFVPVATNGVLKAGQFHSSYKDDEDLAPLVFMNSYHLLVQPGPDIIAGGGGLHEFMKRGNGSGNGSNVNVPSNGKRGVIITDSGGFQVFSLKYGSVQEDLGSSAIVKKKLDNGEISDVQDGFGSGVKSAVSSELKRAKPRNGSDRKSSFRSETSDVKVTEDGVQFRSYRTGEKINLTPESTIIAQKKYGADIIIPLDEVPSYDVVGEKLRESVERSHRWESRSLIEHYKNVSNQAIYGVIHGGVDYKLRELSIEYICSLPFDGIAIGGSLGSDHNELIDLLKFMMPKIRALTDRPVHLLGIADERSIRAAVKLGIDSMDSCYPSRLARHGTLLTKAGKIHVSNKRYITSYGLPIEQNCGCSTCRGGYDMAYLNHLFKAKEVNFMELAVTHNLWVMGEMMWGIRKGIEEGTV